MAPKRTLTSQILLTIFFIVTLIFLKPSPANATTYYISPNGNNSNAGTSEGAPIKSFSTAWSKIQRGDTLILLDGTYTPSTTGIMQVSVPSDDGRRIYIKAKNVGKAVIDAQFQVKSPVDIAGYRGATNLEIEGIVAKNGGSDSNATSSVYYFDTGRNNNANILLKKVSGYNADENTNSSVFTFYGSSGITIEDCIAAGAGRKMIMLYQSDNNVIRRCMIRWLRFDGKNFCGGLSWPAGSGLEVYYGNNNIIENNIGFGNVAYYHFGLKGYDISDHNEADKNKYLGNISMYAGKYADGSAVRWGSKPSGSLCSDTQMSNVDIMTPFQTVGLSTDISYISNNLIQDFLAYKAGGVAVAMSGGSGWYGQGWSNNTLERVTFVGNNSLRSNQFDIYREDLNKYTVNTSKIGKVSDGTSINTGRAQLQNKYVNGNLTSESLWPWPMEDQVREQFNTHLANDPKYNYAADNPDLRDFSVNQRVCEAILKNDPAVAAVTNCNSGPTPTGPTATPTPTVVNSPTPTPIMTGVPLPAKIEAEHYNSSTGTFSVVLNASASNGRRIGYIGADQPVLTYTVYSPMTAFYSFDFATSTDNTSISKSISLYLDNEMNSRGIIAITSSGSYDVYKIHTISNVALSAGTHDVKVRFNTNYFDLDYLNIRTGNITPTPPPLCPLKSQGDADCNDVIDLTDYEIWRKEFTGIVNARTSDFNADNVLSIVDFEIWRKSFLK